VYRREWMRQRRHDVTIGAGAGAAFGILSAVSLVLGLQGGPNPLLLMAALTGTIGAVWLAIGWRLQTSIALFGIDRTDPPA
jgi:hypothetical protein